MGSIDDEDFDYRHDEGASGELEDDDNQFQGTARSTVVQNQPHDEEVALSDTGSFRDHNDYAPAAPKDASLLESMDDMGAAPVPPRSQSPQGVSARAPAPMAAGAQGGGATTENDEGAGFYNPADYRHLNVDNDVRELFKEIERYKPPSMELESKLKPFIPDYIPAVGGIDEFIKVPRPDGKPDFLGLKVLDEPASNQSDPTVLTLQLRTLGKEAAGNSSDIIGHIEHTDENKAKKITSWIHSVHDIHKNKPAASVSYSRRMPDIEMLMQEWPPEMENFLRGMKMPTGELDLDLKTYVRLLCGILDIPVYENPIESLHVLFTLFLEFKSNPIFQGQLEDRMNMQGGMSSMGGMGGGGGGGGMGSMGGGDLSGVGASAANLGGANVMTF